MISAILELIAFFGTLLFVGLIVGLWALPYLIIAEVLIIAWIVWFWNLRRKGRM